MSITFGVDYSGTRPDPKCLATQTDPNNQWYGPVKFVGRYLEPANDWKTLTRAEADALHAAGLAVVGMFETTGVEALKGYDEGATNAAGVQAHRADVGMPADRPVYFAVDFDASATQLSGPIKAYFQGVASKMPVSLVGAYGGYRVLKYLFDNHLITWGHQAVARAWSSIRNPDGTWGPRTWEPRAQLQQYRGEQPMCGTVGDVDYNRALVADYGQWPGPVVSHWYPNEPQTADAWVALGATLATPPPTLKLGDINSNVTWWQAVFASMWKLPADGAARIYDPNLIAYDRLGSGPPTRNLYGDASKAACAYWQSRNAMVADGVFGPATSTAVKNARHL